MAEVYAKLQERLRELDALSQAMGVLEWDHQTHMPPGGAAGRGQQMGTLAAIKHRRLADPCVGDWLDALSDTDDPGIAASVRNTRRAYTRATAIPSALVSAFSEATTAGHAAWMTARKADDFAPFQPALERLIDLSRQQVACLGEAEHPYDLLLSEYDPGSTVAALRPMFSRLADELSGVIDEALARPRPPAITRHFPLEPLKAINRRVVTALGFSMDRGRLDEAEHPFTLGVTPGDVRLTTHYHLDSLLGTLSGTIHETGHGLYEQGLPDRPGTWTNGAAGMGLHESQSRFWENCIGRSLPFCRWLVGVLDAELPGHGLTAEAIFGAANRVSRSLIRVSSDESTYNLHILVRFELELALLTGELAVADLPDAWDEAYERIVGIRPTGPRVGVLQDVHWSAGLLGYFPSYTIGNLYAASFRYTIEEAIPDLWSQVEAGEFSAVLGWLRENIHRHGHLRDAPDVFAAAVGDRDPVADLIAHLRDRQTQVGAL
ncbi:MAG: carboxypeptidase Taq [Myxococcota bacterium]|jgi:carboxypeptidase Taq